MTKILFIPNGEYLIFCSPSKDRDIVIENLYIEAFPTLYRELYIKNIKLSQFNFANYVNSLDPYSPFRRLNKMTYTVSNEMFEVIYD
jgi:hypothetical protein